MEDYKLRKVAVGAALVIAAPLSLASWLLAPASMVEGSEFVREMIETGRGRTTLSMFTGSLFFPAAVIGVLGLLRLLRGRRSLLGTIAGGLAIVGLTLNATALGAVLALSEVSFSGLSADDKAALVDATMESDGVIVLFAGLALGVLGMTGLGVALYRAATVAKASAVALVVYGPIQLVGFGTEVVPIIILSFVVMAVGLIPAGLWMLTATREQWEDPPTYRGLQMVGEARPGGA